MKRDPSHAQGQVAQSTIGLPEQSDLALTQRLRRWLGGVRAHRRRNARLYRTGGWGILVLVGVVAAAQVSLVMVDRLSLIRLSGTAAVRIVSTSVTGGSAFDQSPAGTYLNYSYMVDGTTYAGSDFRRWLNVAAHEPKICYEPGNPANHLLVEGTFRCGSG